MYEVNCFDLNQMRLAIGDEHEFVLAIFVNGEKGIANNEMWESFKKLSKVVDRVEYVYVNGISCAKKLVGAFWDLEEFEKTQIAQDMETWVVLFRTFGNPVKPYIGPSDIDSIYSWLKAEMVPTVFEFGEDYM